MPGKMIYMKQGLDVLSANNRQQLEPGWKVMQNDQFLLHY